MPSDSRIDRRDSEASARLRAEAPAAPRSRPGRSKRSDDSADWPSTEWDKLSDVDYWAELASDKPLTTTAQPAARPSQAGQDRDVQAGAGHGAVAGHGTASGMAPGSDTDVALPARRRPDLAAAPVPAPVPLPAPLSAPAPVAPVSGPIPALPWPTAAAGYHPDDPTIDQGGEARRGRRRVDGALDDDPLTSPSFPRVPADDSRSFRSSRAGGMSGARENAQNAPTQQFASYQSPTAPFSASPAPMAPAAGGRGRRPAYPDDYPAGSGSYSRPGPGAPAGGGGYSAAGAAPLPSGNPYGSYVSDSPSDSLSSRSPRDLNGHPSAPYPVPPADLDGHRHPAPYPPAPEPSRHRDGSYPSADDRGTRRSDWYPQPADSPLGSSDSEGTVPGTGGFEGRGTGRHGSGQYRQADYLPGGYPPARPGQEVYLPTAGYPGLPPAPPAQDPYAQDGYGRRPGY